MISFHPHNVPGKRLAKEHNGIAGPAAITVGSVTSYGAFSTAEEPYHSNMFVRFNPSFDYQLV
jgi:hypothetical protein